MGCPLVPDTRAEEKPFAFLKGLQKLHDCHLHDWVAVKNRCFTRREAKVLCTLWATEPISQLPTTIGSTGIFLTENLFKTKQLYEQEKETELEETDVVCTRQNNLQAKRNISNWALYITEEEWGKNMIL